MILEQLQGVLEGEEGVLVVESWQPDRFQPGDRLALPSDDAFAFGYMPNGHRKRGFIEGTHRGNTDPASSRRRLRGLAWKAERLPPGRLWYAAGMAAEQLQKELSQAREHVIQGRRIVEEQRGRIAQLRAHGHSVKSHEQLLAQFERTLESLQHHERVLMAELAEAENPKGAR